VCSSDLCKCNLAYAIRAGNAQGLKTRECMIALTTLAADPFNLSAGQSI
jgi:hypothetical protein